MHVYSIMTKDPISVDIDTPVSEAIDLMQEKKFRRLPIMRDGILTGIVTDRDLREVSASPATTLSPYELNYLLDKMKVAEAIPHKQNLITIGPNAYIEEAALLMRTHKVGCLPVLENNNLIGIVTETNVFDAFIDIMGLSGDVNRVTIELEDKQGNLAKVANIFLENNINISRIAETKDDDITYLSICFQPLFNPRELSEILIANGYKIHSYKDKNGFHHIK